jgi:hypothetical protein
MGLRDTLSKGADTACSHAQHHMEQRAVLDEAVDSSSRIRPW